MTDLIIAEPMVSLALPSRAERTYLANFEIAAVAVFAAAAGSPVAIAATADLEVALAAARRAWPREDPPTLVAALWAHNLRAAQQVSNLALASDLHGVGKVAGRLAIDVPMALAVLERVAARLDIKLVSHATVLERARLASQTLGAKLDAAQAAGGLKQFNREYRHRRQIAQAQGHRFISYATARTRLERALARAAHAGAVVDFDDVFRVE
jgi:hypothetical protein